ncbi:MAG: PilN domain-containing protein, partial [Chthonomonadaceae bacterium]|nr:PilN domain-containing protein [Chthonomonadaceae bacterium]
AHVYLTGSALPGTTPAETEQILSDVLGMPVSYLHTRLLDAPKLDYATAIGIALQTRPDSLAPINLYPNERAVQRAQKARRQRMLLVGAMVVCLAIAGVSMAMQQLEARGRAFRATVRANEALNAVTTQLEAREKAHRRLLDLENDLTTGLDRAHPAVDVLVALDQALPRSTAIWLTQMSFERNGLITLRGESRSEAAATDFVLALQKAGPFMDVRLGYLGDAEDTAGKNESASTAPSPSPAQPAPGQTKPSASSARKPAQATLSSFIITCRVNPKAQSLLPPKLAAAKPSAPVRGNGRSKPTSGRDNNVADLMDDTGDEFGDQ